MGRVRSGPRASPFGTGAADGVSAHSGDAPSREDALEFRPDHKGRFDEIVARFADGMVHVETMSDKSCYVGFYWDDGRICQWWISSDKKLRYHHETAQADPPISDSGRPPEGGDANAAPGEAGQSGAAKTAHRPAPVSHLSKIAIDHGEQVTRKGNCDHA